jgi:hypothetical protein
MALFSSYDLSGGDSTSSALAIGNGYAVIRYSWADLDGRFCAKVQQSIDGVNFSDLKDENNLVVKLHPKGTDGADIATISGVLSTHIRIDLKVDDGTTGTFTTGEES